MRAAHHQQACLPKETILLNVTGDKLQLPQQLSPTPSDMNAVPQLLRPTLQSKSEPSQLHTTGPLYTPAKWSKRWPTSAPYQWRNILFSMVKTVIMQYIFVPDLTLGCTKLYLITDLENRKQTGNIT
jgi:hypothetical protein